MTQVPAGHRPLASRRRAATRAAAGAAVLAIALAGAACSGALGSADAAGTGEAPAPAAGRLFTRLPASYTGVRFANRLTESREHNVFTYRNFYNGGGVAIGDLTGDSLPELVLTANQGGARLYRNDGRFQFRDVTDAAGLETPEDAWTTGVTMADVNGDGRLDLYVCRAGAGEPAERANALWINEGPDADGVPRFRERAAEYGVADQGWSTHAAFLDYDRDGDLDLFLINNSPRPVTSFGRHNTRAERHPYGGHKLYRNDAPRAGSGGAAAEPRFTDVSAAAGIHGPEIAFGLGLGVADVNQDGWPDVYVSNDFHERDYLYLNRGDGTFDEGLDRAMPVSSYYSMGLDVADVDDDGWPDVYTTDMMPEDETRLRATSSFEGWDVYQAKVRDGYHHQLMRNMLQRNNGDGTFSDVAQMAGVARTDWSWSALIADLDLDGRKDVFVTNGLVRDVTSQDYIAFLADKQTMAREAAAGKGGVDFMRLIKAMPSTPIANYAFHNQGGSDGLAFTNQARAWGLDTPSFSSGAAYGDLDGDGALDLVVNNVDAEAFVYRNDVRTVRPAARALQLVLEGTGANRFAVGARIAVHAGGAVHHHELYPARGFQSSVDYVLTVGVGERATVDSVQVTWPDARVSTLRAVPTGRRVVVRQAEAAGAPTDARPRAPASAPSAPLVADVSAQLALGQPHVENDAVDFDRERLIPKLVSTEGPALAVGDVDGDGLDDLYLGGAKEHAGQLLVQRGSGGFAPTNAALLAEDAISEDVGAVFADVDGDRDLDLYVVSGGSEYSEGAPALQDRLYVNDGRGTFRRATDQLPAEDASGSRVAAADYDGDGDVDLFVGGRVVPWKYGESPRSLLLQNDGRGRFTDVTERVAPELARVGMVTDAVWQDADGDGRADLVVVGEWMPIAVFRNAGGGRLARLEVPGLAQSDGWWNRIVAADVTGDGRVDFVVGNLGLNTRLTASATRPATMHVKDFDGNGFAEQVLATYSGSARWPLALRDELIRSVPPLKARYLQYATYATATFDDVFPAEALAGATERRAYTFASAVVRNDGGGRFTLVPLAREAQLAPVYGILAEDVDRDGHLDLLLAGNFDGFKPDIGRSAASYGLVLRGDGAGSFAPVPARASGFRVSGQTRDLARVRTRGGPLYVAARNGAAALAFRPVPRAAGAGAVARAVARAPRRD